MKKNQKIINEDRSSLHSLNSDQTKKGISTEDISIQQQYQKSTLHDKPSMHTYSINISPLVSIAKIANVLREKFANNVLYCNQSKGQLLLHEESKFTCWNFMDLLTICRMQGSSKGALSNCYKVITIRISKQVIDQRCNITVKSSHPKKKDQFFMYVLKTVEQQAKNITQTQKGCDLMKVLGLQQNSLLQRQILAYKIAYQVFLDNQQADKRYFNLHSKAMEKIGKTIDKFQQQERSKQFKCSQLIQTVVIQGNSLYAAYSYDPTVILHPQYCLYAIEATLCIKNSTQSKIFGIYSSMMAEQNKAFNQQCKIINETMSNKQCWEYLECKQKYRLPSQSQPYYLAIMALREVSLANSFRQLLQCVQKCFSQAKMCCLVQHNGNTQLATMDDILPVMVYIVVRAGIWNFPTIVKMIDDYVNIKGIFQLQERVITTLYVAVEDITKKWAIIAPSSQKNINKQNIKNSISATKQSKQKNEYSQSILGISNNQAIRKQMKEQPTKENILYLVCKQSQQQKIDIENR